MVVVQGGPSSIARQDDDKMSVEARCGSTWKRPGGNTWWVQRPEQDWAGLDDSDVDSGLRLWNIWGRREIRPCLDPCALAMATAQAKPWGESERLVSIWTSLSL